MFRRKEKPAPIPVHEHGWGKWTDFVLLDRQGRSTGLVVKQQRQCKDPYCAKVETRYV